MALNDSSVNYSKKYEISRNELDLKPDHDAQGKKCTSPLRKPNLARFESL